MKRGNKTGGFTIIEVLIVLAIGSTLFVAVNAMLSGNQSQTEFDTGIREIYSSLEQVNSEVQQGQFSNPTGYNCSDTGGYPKFTKTSKSTTHGTVFGCVFIGKIVEFNPYKKEHQYYVYSIVGNQFCPNDSDTEAACPYGTLSTPSTLYYSYPQVLDVLDNDNSTFPPSGTQIYNLPYGFYASYIKFINSPGQTLGLVGFFNEATTTTSSDLTDNLVGITSAKAYNIEYKSEAVNLIDGAWNSIPPNTPQKTPWGGEYGSTPYIVCFKSKVDTNLVGVITLQQDSSSVNISLNITNSCT